MFDLVITYSDDDGPGEILVEGEKFSFGRGSDADHRFEDSGLSRLHATVYREGDRVWVVDENSSNGTFVNGVEVQPGGAPLSAGDLIRIGHYTNLKIEFRERPAEAPAADASRTVSSTGSAEEEKPSMLIPAVLLGCAVLVICVSAILIGVKVMGGGGETETVASDTGMEDFDDPLTGSDDSGSSADPNAAQGDGSVAGDNSGDGGNNGGASPEPYATPFSGTLPTPNSLPSGKTYQQMSEGEKNQYVKVRAEVVSRVIGNSSGESIPPGAIAKIRSFLDSYVSRIKASRKNDCSGGGWLSSDMTSVMTRAKENAPFIIRAFNEKGIDPQVGLYLAMIESEHCPCLQSYTGPLGMFQFTQATGRRYGLETRSGASPSNPDERCEKEPAAQAAAAYMKALTGRIGTGPLSIPLAIASYNSGEGGLGKNLKTALEANESQERSFWTLVENSEKLAEQFQRENIKYVPKFFAAAIIGENPKDFGIDMLPLSLYTK